MLLLCLPIDFKTLVSFYIADLLSQFYYFEQVFICKTIKERDVSKRSCF